MKLVAMTLLGVIAMGGAAACSGKTSEAPKEPDTFDVAGTLTVTSPDVVVEGRPACIEKSDEFLPECPAPAGTACGPDVNSMFSDVVEGAQVTVYEDSGKAIGLGELGAGTTTSDTVEDYSDEPVSCAFPITVKDVPVSGSIYSLGVGDSGMVRFAKKDATHVTFNVGQPTAPSSDGAGFEPSKQDAFKAVQESVPHYRGKTVGEFGSDALVYCGLMQGLSGDVRAVEDGVMRDGRSREEAGIVLRGAVAGFCPEWMDDIIEYYN